MLSPEEHAKKWSQLWNSISDIEYKEEGAIMWQFYKTFIGDMDFGGKNVIELGCGTGINTILMGRMGAKITFLDRSREALNIVKKHAEKMGIDAEYIKSDIFDFRESGKFDFVHSEGVVEHFLPPRRQEILDIHSDILKKGGNALIIVPNKACPGYVVGKFISEKLGNWVYGDEFPYTRHELQKRVMKAGLTPQKWSGGEFVTSFVWFFAPMFLSSTSFMKRSLRFMPGRRFLRLDQDHACANKVGRIIGVLAQKK
ncbi:MAG: class I SAM-dependent methyltransferase [Candidatus Micrarchaeota archaeon]|nr:class I SAM-dependent methyltransferase [Candidatus Micrarchaeota archaeon]